MVRALRKHQIKLPLERQSPVPEAAGAAGSVGPGTEAGEDEEGGCKDVGWGVEVFWEGTG